MTPKGAAKLRRLADREVIALLKSGTYKVDRVTAEVIGPKGRAIKPWIPKGDGRAWVRVYGFGGVKVWPRSKLVWCSVTLQPVPTGWHVHHRDESPSNDTWHNLIALHKDDHKKLHNGHSDDVLPF